MTRRGRTAGWLLVLALAAWPALAPRAAWERAAEPRPPGVLPQLLGPAAELIADLDWIGFQRAQLDGRHELAITRAERALAWAPRDTRGWDLFASYLGLTLASAEREPDPERRRRWLEAGLAAARRGEAQAREPEELALLAAVMLVTHASQDTELPWPGGRAGLWRAAAEAGARAAQLGHPRGGDLEGYARERLRAEEAAAGG